MSAHASALPASHLSVSQSAELPPAAPMSSINSFPPPVPPGSTFSVPAASAAAPSYSNSALSFPANSGPLPVSTFSCTSNSTPVCTVSGPSSSCPAVAPPPAASGHHTADPPLRFSFEDLNIPDLYASFKSLFKTMRERGGSICEYAGPLKTHKHDTHERLGGITCFLFPEADVAPLLVPSNDTTPLHTPTLPPFSPHPTPALTAPPVAGQQPVAGPPTVAAAAAMQAPHPAESERISQLSESHINISTQRLSNANKTCDMTKTKSILSFDHFPPSLLPLQRCQPIGSVTQIR